MVGQDCLPLLISHHHTHINNSIFRRTLAPNKIHVQKVLLHVIPGIVEDGTLKQHSCMIHRHTFGLSELEVTNVPTQASEWAQAIFSNKGLHLFSSFSDR